MHTVEICDERLVVMDEDGYVAEVVRLAGYRDAKRRIAAWSRIYTIEVAAAYDLVEKHFRRA